MKQSLSELQTQVEAKSKVFGKFSPYPISCDDLLWLIKQVNAAQQSVQRIGGESAADKVVREMAESFIKFVDGDPANR